MSENKNVGKDNKKKGNRGSRDTSLDAYKKGQTKKQPTQKAIILQLFKKRKGWTSKELAERLHTTPNTVCARLGELEDILERTGQRRDGAAVWRMKA